MIFKEFGVSPIKDRGTHYGVISLEENGMDQNTDLELFSHEENVYKVIGIEKCATQAPTDLRGLLLEKLPYSKDEYMRMWLKSSGIEI